MKPSGAKAAGVSHDSQRAHTCTIEGCGLQKHHQPQERDERRMKIVVGEGKRVKFWAVLGRAVRERRGGTQAKFKPIFQREGLFTIVMWGEI